MGFATFGSRVFCPFAGYWRHRPFGGCMFVLGLGVPLIGLAVLHEIRVAPFAGWNTP